MEPTEKAKNYKKLTQKNRLEIETWKTIIQALRAIETNIVRMIEEREKVWIKQPRKK